MSIDVLQSKIRKLKTPIVLGLDPTPELIPPELLAACREQHGDTLKALAESYGRFCRELLDTLKNSVPAVKVQAACFEALGWQGVKLMQELLSYAKKQGYYVLLETLRADVGHIAALTARSVFEGVELGGKRVCPYPCDGLILNGFFGSDGIRPYLPYLQGEYKKNLFVVVKSSNKSSGEVQDLISGDRVIHTAMADLVLRWNGELFGRCGYGELGAVVGCNSPLAIQSLRRRCDRLFFLVPGYGAQGGVAKHASFAFDRMGHGAAVCASRSILGAWREQAGVDWPEAALAAVEKMKRQLEGYVTVM